MNERKAKEARSVVYGDLSRRDRTYGFIETKSRHGFDRVVVVCTGLRRKYLDFKKMLKETPCIPAGNNVVAALKKRRRSVKKQQIRHLRKINAAAGA